MTFAKADGAAARSGPPHPWWRERRATNGDARQQQFDERDVLLRERAPCPPEHQTAQRLSAHGEKRDEAVPPPDGCCEVAKIALLANARLAENGRVHGDSARCERGLLDRRQLVLEPPSGSGLGKLDGIDVHRGGRGGLRCEERRIEADELRELFERSSLEQRAVTWLVGQTDRVEDHQAILASEAGRPPPPMKPSRRGSQLRDGNSAVHLISALSPGIASALTPSAVHAG